MSRRWKIVIQLVIVIFWLAMMLSLVKFKLLPRRTTSSVTLIDPSSLVERWRDYEEWMRLYWENIPIGAFHTFFKKLVPENSYLGCVRFIIVINLGRIEHQMLFSSVALLDANFSLTSFDITAKLDKLAWKIKGLVEGKRLYYKVEREAKAVMGIINLNKLPTLLDGAGNILARDLKLQVGKIYRIPVFDPVWSFEAGELEISVKELREIKINNESYNAYCLSTRLGNVAITTWVDAEGRVLKRELPNKIVMIRSIKEEVIKEFPYLSQPVRPPEISVEEFKDLPASPPEPGILGKLTKMFLP